MTRRGGAARSPPAARTRWAPGGLTPTVRHACTRARSRRRSRFSPWARDDVGTRGLPPSDRKRRFGVAICNQLAKRLER